MRGTDILFMFLVHFASRNLQDVVRKVCSKLKTRPGWPGAQLRTQSQHVHVPEVRVYDGFETYPVRLISDCESAVLHFYTISAPSLRIEPLFSLR